MFFHIFKYRFLTLTRDRSMIFWTMIFPLVLATFFKLALGNLDAHEAFKIIDIAVINDVGYQSNQQFQDTIKSLSEGETPMFNVRVVDEDVALDQLLTGEISGYILVGESMKVVVNQRGINQSVIKIFLDQYSQTTSAIQTIIMEEPSALGSVMNTVNNQETYTVETSVSKAEPNSVLMYFYSLIAMACMFGSFFGLMEVTHIQADLSYQGARLNMAPVHKMKAFIYSTVASVVILYIELLILISYMHFGLGIDLGQRIGLVLLTTFVGGVVGIGMGAFIGVLVKGGEGLKIGICIGISNLGSFLAGMMFADMKYIVDTKAPIVGILNPVNLVTDAFYALYYYDSYERYMRNMIILVIFSIVFSLGTYMVLRRKKYASI